MNLLLPLSWALYEMVSLSFKATLFYQFGCKIFYLISFHRFLSLAVVVMVICYYIDSSRKLHHKITMLFICHKEEEELDGVIVLLITLLIAAYNSFKFIWTECLLGLFLKAKVRF